MRACIIAYSFYDIDYRVRRYGDALIEQGYQVDAIGLRRKGDDSKVSFNGATVYQIQEREYDELSLADYAGKNITFFMKGALLLSWLSIRHRYDIIHVHNMPDFLIFMAAFPKLFGTKLILDIHDIMPEFFCQKFSRSIQSRLARIMLLVERISVRFANYVIVANDIWKEKVIARDNLEERECSTLMNYPKMASFVEMKKPSGKSSLSIIYPGTISHLHGVDVLIRALALIKKEVPDVMLDIYTRANNVKYFSFLKSLIADLDLGKNVNFHESLPIEELGKIYSTVDIGVVCKRAGIFASEAFSTKILDYMAAGIPIVSSRTKIDEYYFDDSLVMFYEPEDYEGLARCVLSLCRDPEKRRSLAMRGKAFVKSNTWEVKKMEYLSIVNSLLTRC